MGDVLIAWESEALFITREMDKEQYEIVYPSQSILAEPPVAVVEKNAAKNGTTEVATEYLNYLYSPEAQEIIAKNYYRPTNATVAAKYAAQFPKSNLLTIADFGGWAQAQKKHFDDGGTFDQIYQNK
jgi:sulfate/thiosulfate-binding protein